MRLIHTSHFRLLCSLVLVRSHALCNLFSEVALCSCVVFLEGAALSSRVNYAHPIPCPMVSVIPLQPVSSASTC